MKAIALALVFGAALISPAWPAATNTLFDIASGIDKVTIPASGNQPTTTVSCHYYAHYMVKEIDEGEVGAAQISILAADGLHKPKCERANAAGEKVIDPAVWAGYFKGAKGNFIFVNAADGNHGAMGIALFDTSGKKLFDDLVKGDFHSIDVAGSTVTIKYQRAFAGPCSVANDGAACWTKVASAAGVAVTPAPDCAKGYLTAKTAMAKGRCEADQTPTRACQDNALKELDEQRWNESPSVILFEAETVIAAGKPTTKAIGAALACYPAD